MKPLEARVNFSWEDYTITGTVLATVHEEYWWADYEFDFRYATVMRGSQEINPHQDEHFIESIHDGEPSDSFIEHFNSRVIPDEAMVFVRAYRAFLNAKGGE